MSTLSPPQKILTIDDEEAIVDLIVDILQAHNYRAISATRWTDAVEALTHENPDVVLLDLKMPTIHGTSLLEFIRSNGFDIPVVVVSGFVNQAVRQELYQKYGVQGIITKPFKSRDIIGEIERVLDTSSEAPIPSQHRNMLDALYNRPPQTVPEPDENAPPKSPPSISALYSERAQTSGNTPTDDQTAAEWPRENGKSAPPSKTAQRPEKDILNVLQRTAASHAAPKPDGEDNAELPPPPPELLEALQKRDQGKSPQVSAAINALFDRDSDPQSPPSAEEKTHAMPGGDAPSTPQATLAIDSPLAPVPKREASSGNPFGVHEPHHAIRPRRKAPKGNMLFFGGITVVCILVASFLAVMQWLSSEYSGIDLKKQAQDVISSQVKQEVMKELQKQQLQQQQLLPQKK